MSSDPSIFNVTTKEFNKSISVPSSKSYANRLLILAALSNEDVVVENLPPSTDVKTMISCLKQIGLEVSEVKNGVCVKGSFPDCEKVGPHTLMTGDGGTTNRFLAGFLALGSEKYILKAEGHMLERPMQPLVSVLEECGVKVGYKLGNEWLSIQGPVKPKSEVVVDATNSTQFVTSIAMAFTRFDCKVKPGNLDVSIPYWRLTENLVEKFRANELKYVNPVDFSSLTYPLALAAVGGDVIVSNCLDRDTFQADSTFIEVIEKIGAKVEWTKSGLKVSRDKLNGIEFDGSQCPDAVPSILFVCSFCTGKSIISNLEVLTHKECDRFEEMIRMLRAFGVDCEVDQESYSIIINGPVRNKDTINYTPPEDHRMVMVSYLFLRMLGGGSVANSHHVAKSFSNFFEIME